MSNFKQNFYYYVCNDQAAPPSLSVHTDTADFNLWLFCCPFGNNLHPPEHMKKQSQDRAGATGDNVTIRNVKKPE